MLSSLASSCHGFPVAGENRLLAALPEADYAHVLSRAEPRIFQIRDLLYRAGAPLDYVYFPRSGVLSSVKIMLDGRATEVAAVGLEGLIGISAYLGTSISMSQVFCQIPCETVRLSAEVFLSEIRRSDPFRNIVHRYLQYLLESSAHMIACNALHTIEERCARWLLMSRDRAGVDEFPMTQEFLAVMLGVHRPSVSLAAGSLQNAGLISYRHGRITVLDSGRLEDASCECYQGIQGEYDRQFPSAFGGEVTPTFEPRPSR